MLKTIHVCPNHCGAAFTAVITAARKQAADANSDANTGSAQTCGKCGAVTLSVWCHAVENDDGTLFVPADYLKHGVVYWMPIAITSPAQLTALPVKQNKTHGPFVILNGETIFIKTLLRPDD